MQRHVVTILATIYLVLPLHCLAQTPALSAPQGRTTASPRAEAVLRRLIAGFLKGQPDFNEMAPALADAVRAQSAATQPVFAKLGALKTLTFTGVGPAGGDIYEADFEHGRTEWRIAPLGADGKVSGLNFHPLGP